MPTEAITFWLINTFSYTGIFIASLIVSASIVIPLPGPIVILVATLLNLNFFLVSVASASGSMIGELTGYYAGFLGNKMAKKTVKKYNRIEKFLRKYFNKYALVIIFLAALLPFPFDLVGITAGASRYSIPKFLAVGFVGKFFKTLLLLIAFKYSIDFLLTFGRFW